jgi:hypothetical protein
MVLLVVLAVVQQGKVFANHRLQNFVQAQVFHFHPINKYMIDDMIV